MGASVVAAQSAAPQFKRMALIGIVWRGNTVAVVGPWIPAGLVAQPLFEGLIDNGPVTGLLW